jgi:hypothetical protein
MLLFKAADLDFVFNLSTLHHYVSEIGLGFSGVQDMKENPSTLEVPSTATLKPWTRRVAILRTH